MVKRKRKGEETSCISCGAIQHPDTLLLKAAFKGFFAIATTLHVFPADRRGCAGSAGLELVKAPFEERLLVVCMLDSKDIDILGMCMLICGMQDLIDLKQSGH